MKPVAGKITTITRNKKEQKKKKECQQCQQWQSGLKYIFRTFCAECLQQHNRTLYIGLKLLPSRTCKAGQPMMLNWICFCMIGTMFRCSSLALL